MIGAPHLSILNPLHACSYATPHKASTLTYILISCPFDAIDSSIPFGCMLRVIGLRCVCVCMCEWLCMHCGFTRAFQCL